MAVFHPVCTRLANSGVKHLFKGMKKEGGLDPKMIDDLNEAAAFFNALLRAPILRIAVENPIQHGHAKCRIDGDGPTQIIQPWMFGHPESKATCLWLKNLPKLFPTNDVHAEMMSLSVRERNRVHYMPPGPLRAQERSRTLSGVAEAMAAQWGPSAVEDLV